MRDFEIISTLFLPFLIVYLFFFVILFGQKYMREYMRNKTLRFTQEEVKDKRKEIAEILGKEETFINNSILKQADETQIRKIIKVLSLYNELAVGINEGLYDELYVKMVLGFEMTNFYKNYYSTTVLTVSSEKFSSYFMPLELLLKKWDSDESPSYRVRKHRRYL